MQQTVGPKILFVTEEYTQVHGNLNTHLIFVACARFLPTTTGNEHRDTLMHTLQVFSHLGHTFPSDSPSARSLSRTTSKQTQTQAPKTPKGASLHTYIRQQICRFQSSSTKLCLLSTRTTTQTTARNVFNMPADVVHLAHRPFHTLAQTRTVSPTQQRRKKHKGAFSLHTC